MAEYTFEPLKPESRYEFEPIVSPLAAVADSKAPSFRVAPAPSIWDRITDLFPEDTKAEAAKATNSLVYSEMLGIRPDVAYEYHDEISRQIQDKLSTEKIVTDTRGLAGTLSSAWQSSLAGMMARQQVSQPFESVSQMERWINGMATMALDLPFFLRGYAIGGGNPVTGLAGGFGFTAGLRQILADRYMKGEIKTPGEWIERVNNAAKATLKGQAVGAATGFAGGLASGTALKLANELATMTTAGRLVEGQLPTVQDFIDNAGMLLVMHYGIRGYEAAKEKALEEKTVRDKLINDFVETGVHPKTIAETIAKEEGIKSVVPLIDIIDRVNSLYKAQAPAEKPIEVIPKEEAKIIEPFIKPEEKTTGELPLETTASEEKQPATPLEMQTTSIKNAVTDAERAALGMEPIENPIGERSAAWREDVEKRVDSGEMNPREMARRIKNMVDIGEKVPTLSDEWNHALLYDKAQLYNELNSGKGRPETEILVDIKANNEATKAVGTEQSRALSSRKDEIDLSYAGMVVKAMEDGTPLTPELKEKFKKLSDDYAKADALVKGLDKEDLTAKAKESLDKTIEIIKNETAKKERKEKRAVVKESLDVEFDNLVAKFNKQIGGQLNVGIDPTAIKTLVEMTRNRIKKGMVAAEEIIDSIHTALTNAGIEFSKRDIQDAISQYGVIKEMSKEEIDVKLRDVKAQMRLLSALEDARKGISPEHTGLQREAASDRVRELTRQVNEAMRESGIAKAVDPEKQWKTSLDAVKTRLKNQINDLTKQILTREQEAKTKGIEYDEEANILKSYRDQLKKINDVVFEKPSEGLSPEKQAERLQKEINRELQSLDKQISEYIRKYEEKDVSAKPRTVKEPLTEDIKLMREARDTAKKQVDELRKELNKKPELSEEARELKKEIASRNAEMQRLEKRISEYVRRTAEGDISTKGKMIPAPARTADIQLLRDVAEQAKKSFNEMKKEMTPKATPEQIREKSYLTRLENEIKMYQEIMDAAEFVPKAKKEQKPPTPKMVEAAFKRDQIRYEYMKVNAEHILKNRSKGEVFRDGIIESLNLVKALKSAFDVSAVGRQGWLSFLAHPISGFKDIGPMFEALGSKQAEFRIRQEIMKDKYYPLMKKAGVEITDTENMTKATMEELFQSRWANAIPGVEASNRAFTTYLNLRRLALFKEVYDSAAPNFKAGKASEAELSAIADYVNQSTGRGNIRGYEHALAGLGVFLWAPKLVLSRFQMIAGASMYKGSAATRIAIAKEYGRMLRTLGIIYAVSSLFDEVTIEDNTLSSDWGKIRIGNRRIDPLAGLSQNTVLLSRIWNEEIMTASGRIKPITGDVPYGSKDVWDVMSDFLRTKLTPALGEAINFKMGKDIVGNKVELADIPMRLVVPLSFKDIAESMEQDGIPAGSILSTLSTFGIGVQIYDHNDRR